jgi:Holliday junction resolvase RusA-like endonuclease
MIHKIVSPLHVIIPRRTKKDRRVALNLNIYRNLHHSVNGLAKKVYTEMMREQLEGVKINTPVEITYQVFKPTKRILDKMNVVSVVSKFLLDAITQYGCWEDDNDNFVKTETILPTELDRANPRVEIIIKEI